ncbi:MAG TPA: polysaccharide deacetylase family protein, partial [Labilithrix sp.]|nr:polysaccharide deacetylase family protein [Labilithrix sp.]
PMLLVLVYHRIMRPRDCKYDPNVIEATPEQFDEQMAILRKRHDVADPQEMRELIAAPKKLRHARIGITFDDGYRDNYTYAFPILKSHGLRAMFFLPTHFVGQKHLTWWDQIAWVVRNSTRRSLTFKYPKNVVVTVDPDDPTLAIRQVLHLLTKNPSVDRQRFMAEVQEVCGLDAPAQAEDRQFLSWEEAGEMERDGMTMGSHTHSHEILARLSEPEQKEQCQRSRDLLVENNLKADCLAYPVGHLDSFSAGTIDLAKRAGYSFAFTNYGGVNTPERMDPFRVRRVGMDLGEELHQYRFRMAMTNIAGRELW